MERLKLIIQHTGLSQKDFAERIGLSGNAITELLKGRSKGLSEKSLTAIIIEFSVNMNWFLTGEGEMFLTSPPSPLLKERGEESSEVMQSDAGNGKQNGHLTGINGNVETYPEITSIEQIARTGWWANLTEDDRELYAINEELPHEATRRLRDAAEYEYLVNKRRIEASDVKKTLRQKGEAG